MATDFDQKASTWDDDPDRVERARVAADAIRQNVPLTPATRLLEYGAGTGLVAQHLAGDVGSITLADPSNGMREVMAAKIAGGALPSGARVWDLDLTQQPVPDDRFDLLVTVMTLHHILDLPPVLAGFARMLDHGGHLCVVDLEEEDGSFHDDDAFEGHHGLARSLLSDLAERAGFTPPSFQHIYDIDKDGTPYPMFLAVCRRR